MDLTYNDLGGGCLNLQQYIQMSIWIYSSGNESVT